VDERLERLGAATGLTAVLAVGVPTAFLQLGGDSELVRGPPWVWWTAYLVYLGVFAIELLPPDRRPQRTGEYGRFAVQAVAGLVVFALAPEGWSGVILVVTAATGAFVLPRRMIAAVVVVQTAVVPLVLAPIGWDASSVALNTVLYGSFQAFAVLVALGQRQAAEARDELARTHAELRATAALLATSTRSAERLRISRDLHDLVGHQLTGLALELEVASHQAEDPARRHVANARAIAKDLLRDVREAVGELRHTADGLEPALHELVHDLPGLEVELTVDERVPVDDTRALAVVRAVQEVTTNTLRHADARRLTIRVVADEDGVRLSTRDDGRGASGLVPGNGLTGLRERIEQLGGEVTFDTGGDRPGFGVAAHVPSP
jgi:signal transduction histidine kinase